MQIDKTTKGCESPIIAHRQPPAIPFVTPGKQFIPNARTNTSINKEENNIVSTPPPPQPPQRTHLRSTLKNQVTIDNQNSVANIKPNISHLENATNEAVKLVTKSIRTGSLHNLNAGLTSLNISNQENEKQLEICSNMLINNSHLVVIQKF